MIHVSYLIYCSALPLSLQSEITLTTSTTTSKPVEMDKPIVFSHDQNPFDLSSFSFGFDDKLNISQPKLNAFHDIPIVKLHQVLPLNPSYRNMRQKRLQAFRPLFVYRQEQAQAQAQAMRRHATARPPIDPDQFYHYPYYPHYYHLYADDYPDNSYDYQSNHLSHDTFHTIDHWYP